MSLEARIEYYLELDPTLSYEEALELVLQEDEDDDIIYLDDYVDWWDEYEEELDDFDDLEEGDDYLCYMAV
jgi:hypothetical protein|nr:MAG TPA: hypothetical protein [Caudoviricetes sp.]